MSEEKISKEEFNSYEAVRQSGITNMFDVNAVCRFSGLPKEKVFFIMRNYSKIKEEMKGGVK